MVNRVVPVFLGIALVVCHGCGYFNQQSVASSLRQKEQQGNHVDFSRRISLVILQDGLPAKVMPFSDEGDQKNNIMSITKSVVSLLASIAIEEGLIGPLEEPVGRRFKALRSYPYGQETLRNILQQTSCFAPPKTMSNEEIWALLGQDTFSLLQMMVPSCGKNRAFHYSNIMPNVISQMIEAATGAPMQEYARSKLFTPLDIHDWSWRVDSAGHTAAEAGLELSAADLAKIGQVILQGGMWNGQSIVPAVYIESLYQPGPLKAEHSLLWWLRPHNTKIGGAVVKTNLEGNGWAGQSLIIDRSKQRVTVILTRPQWAWDLFANRRPYAEAEFLYNKEMKGHHRYVSNLLSH